MGRPRNPNSKTDPAILELRRQYYYQNKNRLLEAAKARYRVKVMAKEKEQKPTEQTIKDEKQFYEEWLSQLQDKLQTAKGWKQTAIQNQITTIEHQINNEKGNKQTDWKAGI